MIYDTIIIGAGASGLFAGINLDKKRKTLILEKTDKVGTKLLLSGGERANVTNMNIDTQYSYFSQNKKFLKSIFSKYSNWDFMSFCSHAGLNLVEEDRGRMILETGNSKEILSLFLKKIRNNNCNIQLNSEVVNIIKKGDIYEIKLVNNKIIQSKYVIISSGGKSFSHIGTSGDGYTFAENFGIKQVQSFAGLCGISSKKDLSVLSGISCNTQLKLIDKKTKKNLYTENGPLLFTHFGLSGPIIFNTSVAIGEYLAKNTIESYFTNNIVIQLKFNLENLPKKIIQFFDLTTLNNEIILELHSLRSLKEAKVTTGGIDLNELDNNMQSKKYEGLFFVGEVVDVTGKTGGFNLQWAWSSSFVASDYINKILK